MEILIDHLTRMRGDFICVAGLSEDARHVRPVLAGSRWTQAHSAENGGPFAVGTVVQLGRATPVGSPPEVEDHCVDDQSVVPVARLPDHEFWSHVNALAATSVANAFGPELQRTEHGRASVRLGKGTCSLALVRVDRPELTMTKTAARIEFADPALGRLDLSLTDLRAHDRTGAVRVPMLSACARRIAGGRPLVLAMGLSRPYQPVGHTEPRHWLQVNNLHFDDYLDDHPVFRRRG